MINHLKKKSSSGTFWHNNFLGKFLGISDKRFVSRAESHQLPLKVKFLPFLDSSPREQFFVFRKNKTIYQNYSGLLRRPL